MGKFYVCFENCSIDKSKFVVYMCVCVRENVVFFLIGSSSSLTMAGSLSVGPTDYY
jgi:hypothetical protein